MKEKEYASQVKEGERFEFGKNWKAYLNTLTDERIEIAKQSLVEMLDETDLTNKTFLDVGSGSGLFSLAAKRLGARVFSFDFDPNSVKCAQVLKDRYFADGDWVIEKGSVLNKEYISSLGKFDIVYSWGVLHHTGNLYQALENVATAVKDSGKLFISIYNDQGGASVRWTRVKKIYNSGFIGKTITTSFFFSYFFIKGLIGDILRLRNPVKRYKNYKSSRGMSIIHDWYDWLGGFPFEVATPEAIFEFFKKRNFSLTKLKTTPTLGCNEFVFQKN